MPYYRGDYYRGDYYRGDYARGGIGSFFKKAGKAVGGAVTGFITGGPLGAAKGAIGALAGSSRSTVAVATPTQAFVGPAIRIGAKVLPPLLAGKEVFDVARGFFGGGGAGGRRRTMNHLNPRALARATRRVEGFVKKARKAVSPLGYTVVRRGSSRCAPKRRCK